MKIKQEVIGLGVMLLSVIRGTVLMLGLASGGA
jgi:hypothetical protein